MTSEKLLQVIHRYEEKLVSLGALPIPLHSNARLGFLVIFFRKKFVIDHLYNMTSQMRTFVSEDNREKLMRWLGFMQGVLWVLGVYSLDELKNHNRPDGEDTEKPKESA